jgi:hypothetical protein
MASPKDTRDFVAEGQAARNKHSKTVVDLRAQRTVAVEDGKDWGDLILVAQALLVCGLPYRATDERQITLRYRIAGDMVSVTFTCCRPYVPMPFGADRTLLHWLVDRAICSTTPYVSWETATEFLKDIGLSDQGKNFRTLRERFRRISSTAITIVRERDGVEDCMILPIVERSTLPSSVDLKAEKNGLRRMLDERFGFGLNRTFWDEIKAHNIPVPWELLRTHHKQGVLLDCMLFLYWRSYSAKTPSLVPWAGITEQTHSQDSNPRRVRLNYDAAFKALRVIDSNFPGETEDEGVRVIPYTKFLPGGDERKRLT